MTIDRRLFLRSAAALATSASLDVHANSDDWAQIAAQYDVTPRITNLENGYWGIMAKPVLREYLKRIEFVNIDNSYYARRQYDADVASVVTRVAGSLGVSSDEVVLTRNATEALQNLILGYNKLRAGDTVLYADLDYDSMQTAMERLRTTRGVNVEKIALPEPATYQSLIDTYDSALQRLPSCRLVLLTHLSHRTGLVLPVHEIAELARKRGADVIVDAAHSWGQIDFKIPDLKADFVGVNLHKWIGAPIGNGVLYIRKERLSDIDPYLGEQGPHSDAIAVRVHTGTTNMAAVLTVPAAIDFHEHIGVKNKETRLRALRDRWVQSIVEHPGIEILTPQDARLYAGITSFRFKGKTSKADNVAISRRLADEHGILTIFRDGPAKGCCVRVTPACYTSFNDVDKLAPALRKMLG